MKALDAGGSSACEVKLSKLSYDDPGADDDEWVELQVTCSGTRPAALGEAGVAELALFNGGSAGCPIYRRIALTDAPVGPNGFTVICGAGSQLDLDLGCEQTASSSGPLGQSWLQNGPGDGLALLDGAGEVTAAYIYGAPAAGAGSCPASVLIAEDPGPTQGDDSAVVVCLEGDVVVPMSQAPLRSAANCDALLSQDAMLRAPQSEGSSTAPGVASSAALDGMPTEWPVGTVRHAEPTHVSEPAAMPRAAHDAGALTRSTAAGPPDLGCGVTPRVRSSAFAGLAPIAALVSALRARRAHPCRAQRGEGHRRRGDRLDAARTPKARTPQSRADHGVQ